MFVGFTSRPENSFRLFPSMDNFPFGSIYSRPTTGETLFPYSRFPINGSGTPGTSESMKFIGSNLTVDQSKWAGGVLAPNGKIYGVPYNSTSVLEIDPLLDTTSTFGTLTGVAKWLGGVLAPDGKIYCIPHNATTVLVIDPITKTTSTFGNLTGTAKWAGGVLAQNGKIYGFPHDSSTVLEIDPVTKTVSTFGTLASGGQKWWGGVLGRNGKIFGTLYTSTSEIVIDPITKFVYTYGNRGGTRKCMGGTVYPNNKFYSLNFNFQRAIEIDTIQVAPFIRSYGPITGDFPSNTLWAGSAVAPNGKMYAAPYTSQTVLEFNPYLEQRGFKEYPNGFTDYFKYIGAVLAPNGSIYFIPYTINYVGKFTPADRLIPTYDMLYMNFPTSKLPQSIYNMYQNKF